MRAAGNMGRVYRFWARPVAGTVADVSRECGTLKKFPAPPLDCFFAQRSMMLGSRKKLAVERTRREHAPQPSRLAADVTLRARSDSSTERDQMGDWRRHFRGPRGGWVHPDSPAGGSRPGIGRAPGHHHWDSSDVPHPDSPAGKTFDWSSLARIDLDDRVRDVVETLRIAQRYAPAAIREATGVEFGALLDGLLPGLLMCLCIVAATTVLGAAGGAALGALAMGIGAAPGAAFGATIGVEAGVALLEGLGLAFLVTAIGTSLAEASRLARRAVDDAWHAVDEPRLRWSRIDHAGRDLALAAAALMRGVLQGIVAFLGAKGANAAAARVPELVTKLRASKLGAGFAAWVERNWASLIKNERLKPSQAPGRGGGGKGDGAEKGGARASTTERPSAQRAGDTRPRGSRSSVRDTVPGEKSPLAAPSKEQPLTPQPLTQQQKARAQGIGKTAVTNSNGSVRKGLAEVNSQNLSQSEALEALRAMYEPGRKLGEVVPDGNGNLIVLSRNTGQGQPVNIIDQDGKISFGTADIEPIDVKSVQARAAAEPDPQKKLDIMKEPRKINNVEKDKP
jgi:hypothetical protein